MTKQLRQVKQWATEKIASGAEPPWAWYQYMKLIETIDAILGGMDCVTPTGNLQQSASRQDARLRLVDSTYPQDNAQCHPDPSVFPRLPM